MADFKLPWWQNTEESQAAQQDIRDYYNTLREQVSTQNYGGAASAANAREAAALDRFAAGQTAYGTNRANAVRAAGRDIAKQYAGTGRDIAGRGLSLSDEIDQLYSTLASSNAAAMQQANMASPQNVVGGLAPVSGAAATMQQTVPAYGSNLANYLSTQTGIGAASMYDLASAQQEQANAFAQNYIDQINSAIAKMRFDAEQRAIARIAAAGSARANALDALNLQEAQELADLRRQSSQLYRTGERQARQLYDLAAEFAAARFPKGQEDKLRAELIALGEPKDVVEKVDRDLLLTFFENYLREAAVQDPTRFQGMVDTRLGSPLDILLSRSFGAAG